MEPYRRNSRIVPASLGYLALIAALTVGCASPAPPHAPSLKLPVPTIYTILLSRMCLPWNFTSPPQLTPLISYLYEVQPSLDSSAANSPSTLPPRRSTNLGSHH